MEHSRSLSAEEGHALLEVAAASVRHGIPHEKRLAVDSSQFAPPLADSGRSFVSLHRGSRLLGCVGTLDQQIALICDVATNAHGAAFRDPRLPSVTRDDYAAMTIDVAVLSRLAPVTADSYADLRDRLEPGVDGIVVTVARSRATFLPAVWADLPEPGGFVAALWAKAGLEPGSWPRGITIDRYRTRVFATATSELGTSRSKRKNGA